MNLFVVLLLLAFAGPAHAHYVWLERDGDGAGRVYFGEWHNDEFEMTGGRLDSINPRVMSATVTELPQQRRQDHIELAVDGPGDLWLLNQGTVRKNKETGTATRSIYNARAGRRTTASKLELELVPVAAERDTLVLTFRGKPLPKTRVTVFGPPKWQKSLTTDEAGRITVPTPWAGRYLLHASYSEEVSGDVDGTRFDEVRHITTLSFVDAGDPPQAAPASR